MTSIHAKFDVTSGPSLPQPAEVKFVCDGSTLSGVDLDLMGTDYRVSLLKRKFTSGMYDITSSTYALSVFVKMCKV